jgi:uncharacterized membrane protein
MVAGMLAIATLALFPIGAAQGQTPKYSVRYLGTLTSSETDTVIAVSSDGSKVVGAASYVDKHGAWTGVTHSFLWDGTMHDVGTYSGTPPFAPEAYAVSNDGTVLLGPAHARVWKNGVTVPLSGPDGSEAVAFGINDSDVVAGAGHTTTVVYYDSAGTPITALVGLRWSQLPGTNIWTSIPLQPLNGYNFSRASGGIDANGNIVGTSYFVDSSGNTTANEATLWSPNDGFLPHDLGPASVVGGNGFITGFSVDPVTLNTQYVWHQQQPWVSFYTNAAGTSQLPLPDPSNPFNEVRGVNASGMAAGFALYGGVRHAYCWSNGVQTDLGVPSEMSQSGYARPINDGGFIIGYWKQSQGYVAFLSTPASRATTAKVLDLNLLLTNTLKSVGLASLTGAVSINNAGYILCSATNSSGLKRAALLTRVQ